MEDNQKLNRELLGEVVVTGKKKKKKKEPKKPLATTTIEFDRSIPGFKKSKPKDVPVDNWKKRYQPSKNKKIKAPQVITNYKPVEVKSLSKFKGAEPLVTNRKEIFSTYKQQLENLNK